MKNKQCGQTSWFCIKTQGKKFKECIIFLFFSEEEWKRYYQSLSEGYGAVGFSYDYHNHQHNSEYYQGGYYYKYTFIINLQKKLHSMNFSSV